MICFIEVDRHEYKLYKLFFVLSWYHDVDKIAMQKMHGYIEEEIHVVFYMNYFTN